MKISDIFYSLQGEGSHSGRAAVFVRFFGCNLDCDFCDEPLHKTKYQEMSVAEILDAISLFPSRFLVLTGGEPSLHNLNPFITELKHHQYDVAVETNGYMPENISESTWITYSPKNWDDIKYGSFFDEMKLVVDVCSDKQKIFDIASLCNQPLFIQPKAIFDKPDQQNTEFCINLIKEHPRLRLSLQVHKLVNIP